MKRMTAAELPADHRPLLRRLRSWWEAYETFEGRRYPKAAHVRAFIVKLHEEADSLGIPFDEHHAAVRASCVMTTRSALHSTVRASESDASRDLELARELAGQASEKVVQTSANGLGRIVRRQVLGYKCWSVELKTGPGWERLPATWDYLRNARAELKSKTDDAAARSTAGTRARRRAR